MAGMDHVRVVLVEPEGPLNVGSVARVMKNFGLRRLVLVNPQCDAIGELARKMAVHARDVLMAAQSVMSLSDALTGCGLAIATVGRDCGLGRPLSLPETELPHLLNAAYTETALVFGPESRGLNNAELSQAQRLVRIPTDEAYSSLNLAQAVGLCCYELARLQRGVVSVQSPGGTVETLPKVPSSGKPSSIPLVSTPVDAMPTAPEQLVSPSDRPAALDDLERYYAHLESVLLKIGYLYPHTATSRMRKFRQLLYRTMPTAAELALLRGILRQMEWAMTQSEANDSAASTHPPHLLN